MSDLAQAQAALLDALLQARAPQHGWDPVGLGIYRANAHAHAERSLLAAYPVLQAQVGEATFAALAQALWHHAPPVHGDLGEWGGALAGFIEAQADLAGVPWLGDLARLEWALHRAARAPHATPDPASFALLGASEPEQLRALMAPGTALIRSPWPVLSTLDAHLHGEPDFDELRRRLQQRQGESVRVWRPDGQVRAAAIPDEVAAFEALLADGVSLGQALQAATIDVQAWLPEAVQTGRLLGVAPLNAHATDGSPA